jgi:hypothetical protein
MTVENLTDICLRAAVGAAMAYYRAHGLKERGITELTAALKAAVKRRLPQALADAREALACHMDQAAEATFLAEMRLAGIEAAKEAAA